MTTGTFFFGNIARRKPSLRDRESLFSARGALASPVS
jgi:hypothetical protein